MIIYGLIGFPLSHSFSEKYFREKFKRENLTDHEYRNFPLPSLEELSSVLETEGLAGFNVTIPYKQKIISWIDETDDSAEVTGAVNTVKIINKNNQKILKGYNTDIDGFRDSMDFSSFGKALVLGTGGASQAVQHVLKMKNIEYIPVSRSPKTYNHLLYKDIDKRILEEYSLIINTTPAGMFPDTEAFPDIPYHLLTSENFLYDLIYNPEETEFLKKGKERGCRTMNGLKMLYLQAEASFSIWNEL